MLLYYFSTEMGWSRSALSVVITLACLPEALILPMVGSILDRQGPRTNLEGNWSLIVGLLILGISSSGFCLTAEVMWAEFFGRTSLGMVRGITQPTAAVFAAVGPLLAGVLYDLSGHYRTAWAVLMVAFIAAAGVALLARRPKPPIHAFADI